MSVQDGDSLSTMTEVTVELFWKKNRRI